MPFESVVWSWVQFTLNRGICSLLSKVIFGQEEVKIFMHYHTHIAPICKTWSTERAQYQQTGRPVMWSSAPEGITFFIIYIWQWWESHISCLKVLWVSFICLLKRHIDVDESLLFTASTAHLRWQRAADWSYVLLAISVVVGEEGTLIWSTIEKNRAKSTSKNVVGSTKK